jgi:hypothetical protein
LPSNCRRIPGPVDVAPGLGRRRRPPPIARVPASGYGLPIGCFLVLFAFISPRLALFALFLFSDLLSRAFDSWFVPFLGFFLLPWTTLAYAAIWSSSNRVAGFEWFIVILAFAIDLGSYASRNRARRA